MVARRHQLHGPIADSAQAERASSVYTLKPEPHSSHSIILGWLGQGQGRRLLDVGAAGGLLSGPLSEQGWRVTAIERDPVLAAAGAAFCEEMLVADLDQEIPETEGPFDAIVYADLLEHLRDPLRVLTGLNRNLSPTGQVIVSVPNVAHLWIRVLLLFGRFDRTDRGILDQTHLHFYTERSLSKLLLEAGLTPLRRTVTPAPLYQAVPGRLQGSWLPPINAVHARLAQLQPRLLGYQFVIMARLADIS